MEQEGIGLVLAKATELRLKISNCSHKSSNETNYPQLLNNDSAAAAAQDEEKEDEEDDDEEEEARRLFNICAALQALENQLSSLQDLQQQQQYEREAALADIESSRKRLVDKLKEYKGKELDVLQETSAFACETVEHNGDLLLPPYPSRPPNSMVLDKGYVSTSMYKPVRNGSTNNGGNNQGHNGPKESRKSFRHFIGETLKTALTFVGVVSVLSLTGFGPKFAKRETAFNILGLLQQSAAKEKRPTQCPDGKILVIENGEARCLVRERVEIPFDSVISAPDVDYGCG